MERTLWSVRARHFLLEQARRPPAAYPRLCEFFTLTFRALSRTRIDCASTVWACCCDGLGVLRAVCGVRGALFNVVRVAGDTDGFFWFLNRTFPTVTQLIVVDVVGHLADQIHGW